MSHLTTKAASRLTSLILDVSFCMVFAWFLKTSRKASKILEKLSCETLSILFWGPCETMVIPCKTHHLQRRVSCFSSLREVLGFHSAPSWVADAPQGPLIRGGSEVPNGSWTRKGCSVSMICILIWPWNDWKHTILVHFRSCLDLLPSDSARCF